MNVRPTEPQIMRWTRRSWMRLATINALISITALMLSTHLSEHISALVRLGLLTGRIAFVCVASLWRRFGFWGLANWLTAIAGVLMASGWAIMFFAGRNIDL